MNILRRGFTEWEEIFYLHACSWLRHFKTARYELFFLCRLRLLNMDSRILCRFYGCNMEGINYFLV